MKIFKPKMQKVLPYAVFLMLFTLSFSKAQAQTSLYAGDVAFIAAQMNNNTGDTFAIVLLKNITTGTQIGFTDGCYKDANGYNILTSNKNEWYFVWQAGSDLPKGTIIKFWNSDNSQLNAGGTANASTGSIVLGDALSLNHNGGTDQVFAFQDTVSLDLVNYRLTVGRYLAGIHHNFINGTTSDANWDGVASASGLFQSELPDSLVNGVNCLRLDSSSVKRENAVFTGNILSLDKTVINNKANWTYSNTPETYTVPVRAVWTGSWNGTPSSTVDAVIQSNSAPGTFTCRSLRVDTTYNLTVTSGNKVSIYGDWYNYGNGVGSSNGTITFLKTGTANMYGSSAMSFVGIIEVNNATTLATNNLLTLNATGASTYGQIYGGGGSNNGSITGNITAKYYIGGSKYAWRNICSPLDGVTLADIDDDVPLYFSSSNPAFANVYTYTEAGSPPHWTSPSSGLSQSMDAGGFSVYMRGTHLPVTLDVTGTYRGTSNYALSGLTKTGSSTDTSGWHIIRNPWPTGFYWDGSIANVQGTACYIYDVTSGTYNVFDNINDGVIPPFTAFTIKVTSNNVTVTLPNAGRNVALATNYMDKTGSTENYVGLTLKNLQTNVTDVAKFYTDEDAQNGYDGFDGDKRMNDATAPSIYFTNSGAKLYKDVWQSIPAAGADLPVSVATESIGKHEISANMENIEPGTEVYLEDNLSGKLYDIAKGSCAFTVEAGDAVERFTLHIRKKSTTGIADVEAASFFIGSNGTNVSINSTQTETLAIEITDLLGRTLTKTSAEAQAGQATILPAMSVATGYYLVKVTGQSGTQVCKVYLK
jgi:hypothetical protein